jgi:hypothetical protein
MKRLIALLLALTVLVGCAPQVVTQTVEVPVEVEVTKVVTEVEEVEVPVEVTKEVLESQIPVDLPRDKVFVVDQIYRYATVGNFNLWTPGAGEQPTVHGLMFDTLWYVDQETGEWINSLAIEKPTYNDDYT